MSTSIICPECGNTMRTSASVTADRSVRCPKCDNSFPVQKPNPTVNEGSISSTQTVIAQSELTNTAAAKRCVPARLRAAFFAVAVVLVLVSSFMATAFVWPGFLTPTQEKRSPVARSLLDYLPYDAEFVAGIGLTTDRSDHQYRIARKIYEILLNPQFPPSRRSRFVTRTAMMVDQSDKILLTGKFRDDGPQLQIFHAKKTFDFDEFSPILGLGQRRKSSGVTYYLERRNTYFAMPTDKIMLLARGDEFAFHEILGRKKNPPSDLLTHIQSVKRCPVWIAAVNRGTIRQTLAAISGSEVSNLPELAAAVPILRRSKAATIRCNFAKSGMKICATLICEQPKDARELRHMVNSLWKQKLEPIVKTGFFLTLFPSLSKERRMAIKQLATLAMDAANTLAITAVGSSVVLSAELSEPSLQTLETMLLGS